MKKVFTLSAILFIALLAGATGVNNSVLNTFPSAYIIPSPDGGTVIVSRSLGYVTVVKLNAQEQQVWAKTFDSVFNYAIYDAGVYSDNSIYLINQPGPTITKLSALGDVAWSTHLPFDTNLYYVTVASESNVHAAHPYPDGSLVVPVSLYNSMTAVRLNAAGNVAAYVNMHTLPGPYGKNPCFEGVGTANGGFVLTGKEDGSPVIVCVTPTGNIDWYVHYTDSLYNQPRAIIQLTDGNFMLAGLHNVDVNNNFYSGYIMKVSPQGAILWSKAYVTPDSTSIRFNQIVEDANGDFMIAGSKVNNYHESAYAFFHLSSFGFPYEGYYFPLDSNHFQPRLYKAADGSVKISGAEPHGFSNSPSLYMSWTDLPQHCMATAFTFNEIQLPPRVVEDDSTDIVYLGLDVVSHPDLTNHNEALTLDFSSVCTYNGIDATKPEAGILLFPNPATSQLTINSSVPIEQISIYNTTGQLVLQSKELLVDVSLLGKGVYLAEITSKGMSATMRRFVKM